MKAIIDYDAACTLLPALIRCALADVRAGDSEQRAEAKRFLDLVWPGRRINQVGPPTDRSAAAVKV